MHKQWLFKCFNFSDFPIGKHLKHIHKRSVETFPLLLLYFCFLLRGQDENQQSNSSLTTTFNLGLPEEYRSRHYMEESQQILIILRRCISSSMVAPKIKIISEDNLKLLHVWVGMLYCLNLFKSSLLCKFFIFISRGSSRCRIRSEH